MPAPLIESYSNPFNLILLPWKYFWRLLFLNLLILALGITVVIFFPRTYVSEAKLVLNIGRETVGLDPTATAGNMINYQQSGRRDEMISALKLLTSRVVYEGVVDRMGVDVVLGNAPVPSSDGTTFKKHEKNEFANAIKGVIGKAVAIIKSLDPISQREEAVLLVEKSLFAKAERDSIVIEIKYEAESPELARIVTLTLSDMFRETHRKAHFNSNSLAFFEQQAASAKVELNLVNDRFEKTKNEMKISSIEGMRTSLDDQKLTVARARLETQREVSRLAAKIDVIENQLKAAPERSTTAQTRVPNTGRDGLESQLYTLQMKKLEMGNKLSDDHPSMMALNAQAQEAERQLKTVETSRDQVTSDTNPVHRELTIELAQAENELAGQRAALTELADQDEQILVAFRDLNEKEKEIDDQRREISICIVNYRSYATKLEDARIDNELQTERISSVNLVQPATFQEKPSSPNKLLVLLMCFALGMFCSVGVIALSELAKINREAELRREDSLEPVTRVDYFDEQRHQASRNESRRKIVRSQVASDFEVENDEAGNELLTNRVPIKPAPLKSTVMRANQSHPISSITFNGVRTPK